MLKIVRGVLAFMIWVAVYFFSSWMIFAQILPDGADLAAALLLASAGAFFVWRKTADISRGGLLSHVVLGAAILGGIGFIGGFFGPMIFTPGANQGPLLGLFITGPLGFAAGGIGGAIRWFARRDAAG